MNGENLSVLLRGQFDFDINFRTKLDPNREINEAAQGNELAMQAFDEFHGFITQAKNEIQRGIVFDLHGQVDF